jgi:hypothetical protein
VASSHSYGATLANNQTEQDALSFVLSSDSRYHRLTREERVAVMHLFGLGKSFARAFDLIMWRTKPKPFADASCDDVVLVELKTSKKFLPNNPSGFFFGATENEFTLARRLGESYRFCFVSLHEGSRSITTRTLVELEPLIRTKRTQYQINL